jgi:hypothetical protein
MRWTWLRKVVGYSLFVVAMVVWLALCALMLLINAVFKTSLGTTSTGIRDQESGIRKGEEDAASLSEVDDLGDGMVQHLRQADGALGVGRQAWPLPE